MSRDKTALIIFAREPKEGKVKLRLCKDLPRPTVVRLYKAFTKDTLAAALKAKCDQCFIYYAGTGSSIPFLRLFEQRFRLKRQMGKDLGERMLRAFTHCSKQHFEKIVIIGTDCPELAAGDIEEAFRKLDAHDCVLGPAKDGGYYLIGLKVPDARIFKGISWGTSSVLEQTIRKVGQARKITFLLREREDIDILADLKRLARRIKNTDTAVHTQKVLRQTGLSSLK